MGVYTCIQSGHIAVFYTRYQKTETAFTSENSGRKYCVTVLERKMDSVAKALVKIGRLGSHE
jgi:hypothetical protein